jgi:hypothetical protein
MDDRAHLVTILDALDASPRTLKRPVVRGWVGDWQITGKHGHILADGAGFLLYATTPERDELDQDGKVRCYGSPRRWNNIKRMLGFAALVQDGDDEGIFRLDRLPTADEAELIRDSIGIRRRTHFSADTLAGLRTRFTAPEKRPLAA